MNRSASATALTAAALLSGVFGPVGAASAVTASPPKHSSIFAGYEVSKPSAHIKHVTATFVVPTITCRHRFGGVGPSVLVYSDVNGRTGAHRTSGGGVGVACENGNAFYQSVFIVNDKTVQSDLIAFTPGDVVVVSVAVSSVKTTVTIDDTTANVSKSHVGAGNIASETFIGDNSVNVDGVSGKLDPFTNTEVTNVLVDNRPLGSSHAHRYIWVKNGTTLVTASRLTAGKNFTLTFRNSG